MLGDCWFLGVAAGLAEYPDRLRKIFNNQGEYPKNGAFKFNFFS